ncbi:unnamed protein product [Angiostrongylus costaricensis]|uniref:Bestrophin homolog n=1 Tax=Angiostrongylus costaricensis TaxID=334426 RepID=A0A0R3PHG3_ANGCS|nr:unnamed protein product [Angiostrongylus costaricensis]
MIRVDDPQLFVFSMWCLRLFIESDLPQWSISRMSHTHLGLFYSSVESHDENPVITPFIELLPNITYKGNEIRIAQFNFAGLFPPPDVMAVCHDPTSSKALDNLLEENEQLDCLREIRAGGYDEERETSMVPIRSPQSPNSRTVVCSFRSAAGAPNFGFNKQ